MVWDNPDDDDFITSSEKCSDCGEDLKCYFQGHDIHGELYCRECMDKRFRWKMKKKIKIIRSLASLRLNRRHRPGRAFESVFFIA